MASNHYRVQKAAAHEGGVEFEGTKRWYFVLQNGAVFVEVISAGDINARRVFGQEAAHVRAHFGVYEPAAKIV